MPAREAMPPLSWASKRTAPSAKVLRAGATVGVRASARMPSMTTRSTLSLGVDGSQRRGANG